MAEENGRKGLWEPILERGIDNPHFFNGRLLTALALQEAQNANRQQHRQLGRAIGTGVAYGLEVSLVDRGSADGPPVVSVAPGLAINPAGQPLYLPGAVDVMLGERPEAVSVEAGLFKACKRLEHGGVPPGKGAYVLAVRPASGYRDFVPRMRFVDDGQVDGCGRRYAVEGVQFHLEELPVSLMTGLSQDTRDELDTMIQDIDELRFRPDAAGMAERRAKLSKLRNWLAHACLGTEEVAGFARDPFQRTNGQSPYTSYGAVDALRATRRSAAGVLSDDFRLTDCDVPLALLYWKNEGVHFVDLWSVRRQLVEPTSDVRWPQLLGRRRLSEAGAAFLQFGDQVHDIEVEGTDLTSVVAKEHFRYLPPVGIVPMTAPGSPVGFDPQTLFGSRASQDVALTDGDLLRGLVQEALNHAPIDLEADDKIQLYLIYENVRAVEAGDSTQQALVFASRGLRYRGVARFGYARWDLSRIAPGVI